MKLQLTDTDTGKKTYIELRHDSDGCYRWYGEDGSDEEVSGFDVDDAMEQADFAWGRGWSIATADAEAAAQWPELDRAGDDDTDGKTANTKTKLRRPLLAAGGRTMIKTRLVEIRARRAKMAAVASKVAKARVASAWTIAKTMIPNHTAAAQTAFAERLLTLPSTTLSGMLNTTAKMATCYKMCQNMASLTSSSSPEDVKMATDMFKVVKRVLGKTADDREYAGPQPDKYDEGKRSEPTLVDGKDSNIDASKAGERPESSIVKSDPAEKTIGKTACGTDNCPGCEKCAKAEKKEAKKAADEAPEEVNVEAPAEEEHGGPSSDASGLDFFSDEDNDMDPESAKAEIEETSAQEILNNKIQETESEIKNLQEDLAETEEEIDFSEVFDEGNIEEKRRGLTNEDEASTDLDVDLENGDEPDAFFAPSSTEKMEENLDGNDFANIFSSESEDAMSPLFLTAADINITSPREFMGGDDPRDSSTDHEDDLFDEVLKTLKPVDWNGDRSKSDQAPQLKLPKKAKMASVKHVKGNIQETPKEFDLATLLFPND